MRRWMLLVLGLGLALGCSFEETTTEEWTERPRGGIKLRSMNLPITCTEFCEPHGGVVLERDAKCRCDDGSSAAVRAG